MKIKTTKKKEESMYSAIRRYNKNLYYELFKKRAKILDRIRGDYESGKLTEEEYGNMKSHAFSTGPDSFVCEVRDLKQNGEDVEFELIVK